MAVGLTDRCNSLPIDSGERSSVSEPDEVSSSTPGRAGLPKVGEEGRDSRSDRSVSGLPITSESATVSSIVSSIACFSLSSVGI
jgi:hypothetical protein